jgi:hypothetical protein
VSSPESTGGAGTGFEQHVGAYWLAQLLVGGIPPILIDSTVAEVSYQTERLGWHTDDFLVVCQSSDAPRKIAGQVKRSFTVSATNDESVQTVTDFWKDFTSAHFSRVHDRLVLVTLRGTNRVLDDFVGLLDCARAARDGTDFEQRLETGGFVSATTRRYCGEIRTIIGNITGAPVSAADIWPFLRILHVLSLDLHSSTSQAEAHVKSMLALTATHGDPVASASISWNELVQAASAAMVASRSLRRSDLPPATLTRHGVVTTNDRRILQALQDHTQPVLRSIRSTLGRDMHLQRAALVQQVLDALQRAQVVLVTGPAGCGKSSVGKDAVSVLARDHFLFGFRVEEFAQPHLDATLTAAQVPGNWEKVRGVVGAQGRKVVLIESVERLLERSARDAFADLIMLVQNDPGLRVVLTCRDYSADQVRASFLRPHRIQHEVVRVPQLSDAELMEVAAVHPEIARPLENHALRNVLRNPYFLDKALSFSWSSEATLPQTEREFRALFWREIVRAGHRVGPPIARQREEVLEAIAIRRARALAPYVRDTGLDTSVVESLRGDSLITCSDADSSLVATAHDVLEDWVILQWIEKQHLDEASFKALSNAIGTHPAVRRSYRKWVAELVESDAASADRLFQAALSETQISVQFRDDTLVSLLKAPSAPEFLARHEGPLLVDGQVLLRRVIHLLRVACVTAPDWLGKLVGASILNIPDGSAWPAVLRLVHRNLANFADGERLLLLGLVEDAVRGVSWSAPDLEGAESVVGIAHWLLDGFHGYRDDESRDRVLKVIAKLPKADPARFEAVLRGRIRDGEPRDRVGEAFQDLIIAGTDGMPAARDLPDVVVSVAGEYLLAKEEDVSGDRRYAYRTLEIDLYFGIKEELRRDFFPPSAIRGPWFHLLRHHAAIGLDFYSRVFSHSADWYAHPRLRDRLESPWEVELTFSDGSTRKQWTNARLWGLYRGMTVGPYALESMLMALEKWLLEVGKQEPAKVDALLVDLLRRSENGAIAAVVASVATAYPRAAGEALLVLLGVRDYIRMDRSRLANERRMEGMAGMFPTLQSDNRVYELERKEAGGLEHRRLDLEAAIASLQLGPYAQRTQALLDRHLAALPPKDQQDEKDRLWRLALHRMDLRQYTVVKPSSGDTSRAEQESDDQDVRLDQKPLEADVQTMVDENASRLTALNIRLGVLMWALKVFEREADRYDPSQWATKLAEAQAMDREAGLEDGSSHAPGIVAAVCVRDHWEEMSSAQREWCVDAVCAEVLRHADTIDHMEHVQKTSMAADRSCALVLVTLLRKELDPARRCRVKTALAAAITHPVDEVRKYATWSIDADVWRSDRCLAMRCINAIATEAAVIDAARQADRARPYEERRDVGEIMRAARADVRVRFWVDGAFADDAYATLDIAEEFGAHALERLLVILGRIPEDPLAAEAFLRASRMLVTWWTSGDETRDRERRNYHTESDVSQRIQEFLLRTSPEAARDLLAPLLATIDRHSRELHHVMQGLTGLQDRNPNTPQYWFLWGLFSNAIKEAKWLARLGDDRYVEGVDLLAAVFLTLYWKDNVRHWRYLDGYAERVPGLFEVLPPAAVVLENYVRFLWHIGRRSLPQAFIRIESALRRGSAQEMLSKSEAVFMLEVLLQQYVYGRPLEVKRDERLRSACLFILDCLVDIGSSAAFRMRDDLVTPAA